MQRLILFPPDLWEKSSQSPPPVKRILKSKDHNYNKWTQVRLHQDQYLKTEKLKREPIPIPIIETGGTERKRIIGSVPLFNTEMLDSESETESLPVHSKYIDNALKRKGSHDPTFGVYQDDKDSSFKIGRSSFKYHNKRICRW